MTDTSPENANPNAGTVADRHEFMRGEGFVLYTATNLRALDLISNTPLVRAKGTSYTSMVAHLVASSDAEGITQSNAGLHLATRAITLSNPMITSNNMNDNRLRDKLGVTTNDNKALKGKHIFRDGLQDRPFPWNFSAGLASIAVQAMVDDEKIDDEQAAELGLVDWANIIGSGWFGRLMHSMAFTHNGMFQGYGQEIQDFRRDRLAEDLTGTLVGRMQLGEDPVSRVVDTHYEKEEISGDIYLTASLSPYTRQLLRLAMRYQTSVEDFKRDSIGCPVARKTAHLPVDALDTNPHLKFLESRGIFELKPDEGGATVRVQQSSTAIDRTLTLHAELLERYDKKYGMPQPARYNVMRHVEMPETGVLVRR